MPLDAVSAIIEELVEGHTEFGSTSTNRPRIAAGYAAFHALVAGSGTALVPGVVTAFDEGSFLASVDTVIAEEAVSATDVPYLGVTVLGTGDTVYLGILVAPTEAGGFEDGEYVVVGAVGLKGAAGILCTNPIPPPP